VSHEADVRQADSLPDQPGLESELVVQPSQELDHVGLASVHVLAGLHDPHQRVDPVTGGGRDLEIGEADPTDDGGLHDLVSGPGHAVGTEQPRGRVGLVQKLARGEFHTGNFTLGELVKERLGHIGLSELELVIQADIMPSISRTDQDLQSSEVLRIGENFTLKCHDSFLHQFDPTTSTLC